MHLYVIRRLPAEGDDSSNVVSAFPIEEAHALTAMVAAEDEHGAGGELYANITPSPEAVDEYRKLMKNRK